MSTRDARSTSERDVDGEKALRRGEGELRDGEPGVAARQLAVAAQRLTGERRGVAVMLAAEAHRMAGDVTDYADLARLTAGEDVPPVVRSYVAGVVAVSAGDHSAAVRALRTVLDAGRADSNVRESLWLTETALLLGEADRCFEHATAAVSRARLTGDAELLPTALAQYGAAALVLDRNRAAVAACSAGVVAAQAVGQRNSLAENLVMQAVAAIARGERDVALDLVTAALPGIGQRGLGKQAAWATWTLACVDLLDERPDEALGRLRTMATGLGRAHPAMRVIIAPQLVEAAVRCDRATEAAAALAAFEHWVGWSANPSWLAQVHRCHALLTDDDAVAAEHFETSIALHCQAGSTLELGRTKLHYARRLRRERLPSAAREHLRDALRLFQTEDAGYWAEQVRAELRATGAPDVDGGSAGSGAAALALSPQQAQVARLVADGLTNREIARSMSISSRTVDHHLRNIFARLGARSRVEVATAWLRFSVARPTTPGPAGPPDPAG
ncbi:LuxR C-terminal-related transcriptional regulator [Angustibacter luteus]|uniref:LuxR C-terminal-related transcriptional regulator n=1 Tax=Angustibacter luteus TaxID=658456 RepID=A0ABW1JGU7_9ACTN